MVDQWERDLRQFLAPKPGVRYGGGLNPIAYDPATDRYYFSAPTIVRDMATEALDMFTAPRDVYRGTRDAETAAVDTAVNMAGGGAFTGALTAPVNALAMGGARSAMKSQPPPGTSMYDLPAGSDPRYTGAAPDRSSFSYVRYRPKKMNPRLERAITALRDPNNPVRQELAETIRRGQQRGGMDWYNTEELRDWFVKELGEVEGDAEWRAFLKLVGSTSPQSDVEANIKSASAVRQRLANDPNYATDLAAAADDITVGRQVAKGRPSGYGHLSAGLQETATGRMLRGDWDPTLEPDVAPSKGSWVTQPKPKGFFNSLIGNVGNIAADLHFTRYMGRATGDPEWLGTGQEVGQAWANDLLAQYPKAKKYFKAPTGKAKEPTFRARDAVKDGVVPLSAIENNPRVWASLPNQSEYWALEEIVQDLADEFNMTPAQVQANLWMGAADETGVASGSQATFMEIVRKRADARAKATGQTREEVMQEFIRNKGLLNAPVVPGYQGPAMDDDPGAVMGPRGLFDLSGRPAA